MLRAALGEQKLTFLGASYGTYLGAVYATLFPAHVRRMVFDSVVDPRPEKIWYQNNLDQYPAFERRWNDWKRWVARHDAVYGWAAPHAPCSATTTRCATPLDRRRVGGSAGRNVGSKELLSSFLDVGYYDATGPNAPPRSRSSARATPSRWSARPRPTRTAAAAEENQQRRLHRRRVQRRALAARLGTLGPRQHRARAHGALRDLGQRLDESAVRLLAGATAVTATGRAHRAR